MSSGIFHQNFPQVNQLQEKYNQAKYIIGLDLHKKTVAITVVDINQREKPVFQRKRLNNELLLEKLQQFEGEKMVVAEASYGWFPLRDALSTDQDITFVIFDPRKTSSWMKTSGIKNDKIDSEVLAYACLQGGIPQLAVYQPSANAKEKFKLVNFREILVRQSVSIKNQLKAIERDYGINSYTGEMMEKTELIRKMENILLDQLNITNKKLHEIEEQMKQISDDDKASKLLRSIPGIGFVTAYALRWKMEDINRFEDSKHLTSYFGFGIRQNQSGEKSTTGKMTKTGNRLIRKLVVQGAQVIRNIRPEYLALYFPKLAQENSAFRKKPANKIIIALARKNLSFVYYIWKDGNPFDLKKYRERRLNSLNNLDHIVVPEKNHQKLLNSCNCLSKKD